MDNPSLILLAVDKRLNHELRLVLYGRSAVCLGFTDSPPEAAKTQDVDAIISIAQSKELASDTGFWDAVEGANAELAAQGLYITHLLTRKRFFSGIAGATTSFRSPSRLYAGFGPFVRPL